MFQVKNREALRLLAGRQMRKSRQRNAIAVGAIVLTTILFSTLFTVGGGVLEQARQSMMRVNGTIRQASLKYLSLPEYEKVKEAGGYEGIGYSILTGAGADERLRKLPTEVRYGEDYMAKSFLDYPTEGHMPEKKMEIATSRLVLDAMGLPDELGSRFVFPIEVNGTLHEDTFTLCGVWDGDSLAPAQQAWVSESYSGEVAPVLMTRRDTETPYGGSICAEVDFSNTWNLPEKMADLLKRAGLPEDTEIGINPVYTEFQVDPSLVIGIVLLLTAVLVSGYLIIYNVFYISVTQDIQFYGLLKTIGASGKQLRRIVFRQAAGLSCVGVPVGLLGGYLIGKILLPFVVMQFNMRGFDESAVSPLVLAGAAAFSLLTVWISFRSPGRIAASVSPVEAVRYTGGIQGRNRKKGTHRGKSTRNKNETSGKGKKSQSGKWRSKGRDASGLLGLRNLRRDGKKAVLVILSLFLSMTLLNTTYTILRGFDLEQFAKSQTNGDFEVTDWTIGSMVLGDMDKKNLEGIDAEFEEAVSRMPGLERFEKVYCEQGMVELSPKVQDWIKETLAAGEGPAFLEYMTDEDFIFSYAATGSLTEQIEYREGTFDPEKWAEGNYVIYDDRYGSEPFYRPGDQIILEGKDGQKKEYTVMANGSLPYTLTSRIYINLMMSVILPEQEFAELYGEKQPLCVVYDVKESCREAAEKETARLAESSDKIYTSYETLRQEFEQTKRAYTMIGGILSLILGAIGILNFVNIVVTGILARQKELAMLSAVGMGGRQMKRMLIWESGAYIGGAAFLTVTVGNVLGWLICQNETIQNQWAFAYHFTVLPVVVCLPVLIGAASAVPLLFYRQICKKSVVERLRYV